jgi:two-component system, cell cycle response regulator DivK
MALNILVVEDERFSLLLVRLLLERAGYRVLSAGTAEEALDIAVRQAPDLILMDISLPGMDGLEAVRILKANPTTRGICVVALSAHAMKSDADRAHAAGCDGYLTKPIDTRTFPQDIAGFLESARQRRE